MPSPLLLLGALAGVALLLVKSAPAPAAAPPPSAPPEPPPPPPPGPDVDGKFEPSATYWILNTKQVLKPGEKLPYYEAPLTGGEGVFSTKQGGPARKGYQANPLYAWKFAPLPGQTPRAFAKSFTGDAERYAELIGMPGMRFAVSKTYPSGIKELRYESVGILSPSADGESWLLLKSGDAVANPWIPPAVEAEKIAIMLPLTWRTEITEMRRARADAPTEFKIDEGAKPVFAESK